MISQTEEKERSREWILSCYLVHLSDIWDFFSHMTLQRHVVEHFAHRGAYSLLLQVGDRRGGGGGK